MTRSSLITTALPCFLLALPYASAATFQTLYSFKGGSDVAQPTEPPVLHNGVLYGLAGLGGGTGCSKHQGCGGFYSLDLATGAETVLHSFKAYPQTGIGRSPEDILHFYKGRFYTDDFEGGANKDGDLYYLTLGGYGHVVYSFSYQEGGSSVASLILNNGIFYGTASAGLGFSPLLFKLDPKTNLETTLYTFPVNARIGSLLPPVMVGNTIYGAARFGGANNLGFLFSYDITTGVETDLHDFEHPGNGQYPTSLILYKNKLWGTSYFSYPYTEVFSFDLKESKFRIVHQASPKDGAEIDNLVAVGDLFYGTGFLNDGGTDGAIFSVDPRNGVIAVVQTLPNEGPSALTLVNGTLYGTTYGGATGNGTVFAFTP